MFKLFNKVSDETEVTEFDSSKPIPRHVAIIMDGNGRWAQRKMMPRIAGHKEGMNNVKRLTKHASRMGVEVLTLYAFSTENWKRPTDEVDFLMKLPVDFFDVFIPELIEENVKVNVMGYTDYLPNHTKKAVFDAMDKTKNNTGMILNFALNYGSRAEILTAVNQLIEDAKSGELIEEVTEELFGNYLMTAPLGKSLRDPDLLIRTSGEERISNFLLWQIAYSELVFDDKYWPDFSSKDFDKAVASFQHRKRRFGGLIEESEEN